MPYEAYNRWLWLPPDLYSCVSSFLPRGEVLLFLATCRTATRLAAEAPLFPALSKLTTLDSACLHRWAGHRFHGHRVAMALHVPSHPAELHKLQWRSERLQQMYGCYILVPLRGLAHAFICSKPLRSLGWEAQGDLQSLRERVTFPTLRSLRLDLVLAPAFDNLYSPCLETLEGFFSAELLARHSGTLKEVLALNYPTPFEDISSDEFPPNLDTLEISVSISEHVASLIIERFPRLFFACGSRPLPEALEERLGGHFSMHANHRLPNAIDSFSDVVWFARQGEDSRPESPPEVPVDAEARVMCHARRDAGYLDFPLTADIIEVVDAVPARIHPRVRILLLPATSLCVGLRKVADTAALPEQLHITARPARSDYQSNPSDDSYSDSEADSVPVKEACPPIDGAPISALLRHLNVVHVSTPICAAAEAVLAGHGFVKETKSQCIYCPPGDANIESTYSRKTLRPAPADELWETVAAPVMEEFNAGRDDTGAPDVGAREEVAFYGWRRRGSSMDSRCAHHRFLRRARTWSCRWWASGCDCRFAWRFATVVSDHGDEEDAVESFVWR